MNRSMPDITQYTSIARPLDPVNYRTNLFIMLFTVLAGIVAGASRLALGLDLTEGIRAGFFTGAAVFLAWVISREIDPDYPYSAFVSAALAAAAMFAFGFPDQALLPMAACVVLLRIVNRSLGPAAKPADAAAAIVLGLLSAATGYWPILLIVMLTFVLDAVIVPGQRIAYLYALITLGLSIGFVLFIGIDEAVDPSLNVLIFIALISMLYTAVIYATRSLQSRPDMDAYQFVVLRVQGAMMLLLLAGFALLFWLGDDAVFALLAIWASCLGVSVHRVYIWAVQRLPAR